jgi:tetratricopeptide (TPR) repeat protein
MEWHGAWAGWAWLLETGLEISRQQGDTRRQAALLDRLGDLKRNRGDWDAAVACHQEARSLSESVGDELGRARALANLGHVYRLQRQYTEAQQAVTGALSIYQACNHPVGQADTHTNLGFLHSEQQEWDQALAHHQVAYRLGLEMENLPLMARAQHNMGTVCLFLGNKVEAESHLESAIALYEQTHAPFYLAAASMDLGNVYLKSNQPEKAELFYLRARDGMQSGESRRGLAQVHNNLGMACARQEKWALAEDTFRRSIALWRELGEPVSQANAEDNLAEAYLRQKKWQAARELLDQASQRLSALEPTARIDRLRQDIHEHLETATAALAGRGDRSKR